MTRSILFLCDHNTARSAMAEGLLRGKTALPVSSAGLAADDAADPFAIVVLREDGIDISAHTPAQIQPRALKPDTLVVALSLPAFEAAQKFRAKTGFELEYWALPALPSLDGGRETILDAYRAIRDALKLHIKNRFPLPSGEG
jgi:protein-tyrosine-phosphatase